MYRDESNLPKPSQSPLVTSWACDRVGELELESRVSELFNEMDVDDDGVLDVSEFEKHLAKDGEAAP